MLRTIAESTRLQAGLTLAASVLAGAASGGAGAAVAVYAYRDAERDHTRAAIAASDAAAQARSDLLYLSRREWAAEQTRERERLDVRLEAIRTELQRLALAIERLRR